MVVREEIQERKPSLGRKLIEVPGYTFRIFVTDLAEPAEEIWRDYNQRACAEQRIEELKSDLVAGDFCLREFFATEAALLDILMLFNLLGEFQRASGMSGYRQPATLRVQAFLCGAILGRAGHRVVPHLSAA
jgi:DNA-directed RNA polymerase subunit N (RpoN/RPB10)